MGTIYLTEDQIIEHVTSCWDISDKHWKKYEKPSWDLSWQLYENKQDWSDKKKWQSKVFWPKIEGAVDTTRALLKRALRGFIRDDWFTTEGISESDNENDKPSRLKKVVARYLQLISYIDTFLSCVRTSLISSIGICKIYSNEGTEIWDYDEKAEDHIAYQGWEPFCAEVDPYDLRFSYDCRLKNNKLYGTYVIERIDVDYTDLKLQAKQKGYTFDKQEIRTQDYPKSSEMDKMARDQTKKEQEGSGIANPIELKEFHGYIRIDPDDITQNTGSQKGVKTYSFDESRRYVITIANDKALLRVSGQKGQPSYPNPDQEFVYYIIRPMMRRADEIYGKALAKSLASLQIMLNDIWNLNMDNSMISILKLFGIDVNAIYDMDDLEWSPGNLIRLQGKVGDALQEVFKGSLPPESQWIPAAIEATMDRHSGVTPSVEAGIATQGIDTATEYMGSMQQSALKFEDLGKTIEDQGNVQLLAITDLILTMPADYHWMVETILEETPEESQDLFTLSTRYDVRITGISGMINKLQTQNKLLALLQILGPMASTLGVNIRPIVKGIIRANEDILDTPIEEIFPDVMMLDLNTINQLLMQIDQTGQLAFVFNQAVQQMQQQAMQQGRGNAGTSGASNAQPGKSNITPTSANPMAWARGGGGQG
jgi:hypothetical protein